MSRATELPEKLLNYYLWRGKSNINPYYTPTVPHTCKGLDVILCVSCDLNIRVNIPLWFKHTRKHTHVSRSTIALLTYTNLQVCNTSDICSKGVGCKFWIKSYSNWCLKSQAMPWTFFEARHKKCSNCGFSAVHCLPMPFSLNCVHQAPFLIFIPSGPAEQKGFRDCDSLLYKPAPNQPLRMRVTMYVCVLSSSHTSRSCQLLCPYH